MVTARVSVDFPINQLSEHVNSSEVFQEVPSPLLLLGFSKGGAVGTPVRFTMLCGTFVLDKWQGECYFVSEFDNFDLRKSLIVEFCWPVWVGLSHGEKHHRWDQLVPHQSWRFSSHRSAVRPSQQVLNALMREAKAILGNAANEFDLHLIGSGLRHLDQLWSTHLLERCLDV